MASSFNYNSSRALQAGKLLIYILFITFIIYCNICVGQTIGSNPDAVLINGYKNKVSGDDYSYHSSVPAAEESLIVRATDGLNSMEWETDIIPPDLKGKYITYVWLAGIGSSPGLSSMDLMLNGEKIFTFRTDGLNDWKLNDREGRELMFHSDMTDQYGDKFGFMYLTIPNRSIPENKQSTIRVTGGNDNLTSWYMTYKLPLKSYCSLKILPSILKTESQFKQLVSGGFFWMGNPDTLKIYFEDKLHYTIPVIFGYNHIRFGIPESEVERNITLNISTKTYNQVLTLDQKPVKRWYIDLIQHSHTDIGYTRSQSEILAEHLRYIDYALDYCDITDSYPDAAKFRWTCESSWAVDEYLKCRPASQIERFKKRIGEKRIDVTGMYFNFDELPDENTMVSSLMPLKTFREYGIEVKSVMQNDVNGIAWCMSDYYHDIGVKYLNMGTHGHRALICFDKPTMFWWESPSGKRMLAFRAEHYMTGNTVFQLDKGDLDNFEYRLLKYLTDLEAKGYAYDEMAIQHSGYLTDNSPPSTISSEVINKWNELFEWPKLRTSTVTAFFEHMEEKYSDLFPVYRDAWPDWWTDGFGASAREVAAIRKTQSEISAVTGGMAMARLMGSVIPDNFSEKLEYIYNAQLFYTEHTVGYSESVREPYHQQTMEQRAIKESYAWEAYRRTKMLGEEVMGQLQSHFNRLDKSSVLIFNTLNWERDGLVTLYIDNQIIPIDYKPRFYSSTGDTYSAQLISRRSDGAYWAVWVKNVPATGYRILLIDKGIPTDTRLDRRLTNSFENNWYTIKINPDKGIISSLYDKELNEELIDLNAKYGFGEFIYERLGNRQQLEMKKLNNFTRTTFDTSWVDNFIEGAVWNTLKLKGRTEASIEGYDTEIEINLFNTSKRLDLKYSIVKKPDIHPEGIYISFPFLMTEGKHVAEVAGGIMEACKDQLKGSSNDWNTFQNYTAIRNKTKQVIFGSMEAPLVQFGNINTGRFRAGACPESSALYSWPMNNYWVTNFNPDQRGEHEWSYYITSTADISETTAARFGWGNRSPFLTRVLAGGGKSIDPLKDSESLITNWPDNIILINMQPGDKGILIHVRETGGRQADLSSLTLSQGKQIKLTRVDALKHPLVNGSLKILPYESGFFLLSEE